MKTKELYFLQFLVKSNSQNRQTNRLPFSIFLSVFFLSKSLILLWIEKQFDRSNNGQIKQVHSHLYSTKVFVFGMMLATSAMSFSQSTISANLPKARMTYDNGVEFRDGLNETYQISIGHFGFSSTQEAIDYFQAREIDYVDFVVVDMKTVLMQLDINNLAVSSWTINDWIQVLDNRSANVSPRTRFND